MVKRKKLHSVLRLLDPEFEIALLASLKEYRVIYAWTYKDMPGLSVRPITLPSLLSCLQDTSIIISSFK